MLSSLHSQMWKLIPDINGSYINGTWTQIASLPNGYAPQANAGVVLADGRVIFQGGENLGTNVVLAFANLGYIFDPVADVWTPLPPPPFFQNMNPSLRLFSPRDMGDVCGMCLADGTYIVFSKMSGQMAKLDLKTLTWTELGTSTYDSVFSEQNLNLLPNGKVLTVKCYGLDFPIPNIYPQPTNPTGVRIYDPETDKWECAAPLPYPMTDLLTGEMGAAILRPDGLVAQFSGNATGKNAMYDYKRNIWFPLPTFPLIDFEGVQLQLTNDDVNAILLPNGNILAAVSYFQEPPLYFFELTYDTLEFIQTPTIPNTPFVGTCWFLMLPTGQVLEADESIDVEIYTPANMHFNPCWRPIVQDYPCVVALGQTYKIEGVRFNGMSQCAQIGDDYQAATNYPLVRITNKATGHVFYCRTHDHSSMAVASNKKVHTYSMCRSILRWVRVPSKW